MLLTRSKSSGRSRGKIMNGITLRGVIEQFGFKTGVDFWIRWNIIDPTKIFYWKYIIARPLCTECGYFLCRPDCKAPKITGRRNIIKYERERHKKIDEEFRLNSKSRFDGDGYY